MAHHVKVSTEGDFNKAEYRLLFRDVYKDAKRVKRLSCVPIHTYRVKCGTATYD